MITQTICTCFRAHLLLGVHDFRPSAQAGADIFKLALYTSLADLNADTTAYTATGEVSGSGYVAGGAALTNLGVTATAVNTSSGVGFASFDTLTFSDVSVTARGALIYNSTPSANANDGSVLTNPAVAVLDFGADKVSANGIFEIEFPTADLTDAIVRIR